MKVPQYSTDRKLGINMTPMIDVVFLLIIFFLVSSHLARQETQMELPLPIAKSSTESKETETPRVTLNVLENGQILMAGREILAEQLAARLAEIRAKEGDDLEVRIRASRETLYAFVEPIMLACTESGIWNVSYAVFNREQPK
jgi:biopolymer transport protein ExbD